LSMIAFLDVHYSDLGANAACVRIADWPDDVVVEEYSCWINDVDPYVPGEFYRRELPCLLAALGGISAPVDCVVVDGYVWLDAAGRRGLGAHLYDALDEKVAVVGVAKSAFADVSRAIPVLRGASKQPLYVTSVGTDATKAASRLKAMHGEHRIPTILKRVDRLARDVDQRNRRAR